MDLFRIVSAPFADLNGKGGFYASGRWHRRGRPIVYTSPSRPLAVLERLVHTDAEEVPDDLVLLTIHVPDDLPIDHIHLASLPPNWTEPLHPACMARGDAWLKAARTPLLRVPSVLVPEEYNLLLNPAHPALDRVRIESQRAFTFDVRLLTS